MDDTDAARSDIPSANRQNDAIAPEEYGSVSGVSHVEFAACYVAEMPYLIRYLQKCFDDADFQDAADAAQNAFTALLTDWDSVRNPRAWLRTVAFREMLRRPARAEYPLDTAHREPESLPASRQVELREQEQTVLSAIRQLPLRQRQVFALIYDQFSYREIAEIMNISEQAVRQNAKRARTTVKETLGILRKG